MQGRLVVLSTSLAFISGSTSLVKIGGVSDDKEDVMVDMAKRRIIPLASVASIRKLRTLGKYPNTIEIQMVASNREGHNQDSFIFTALQDRDLTCDIIADAWRRSREIVRNLSNLKITVSEKQALDGMRPICDLTVRCLNLHARVCATVNDRPILLCLQPKKMRGYHISKRIEPEGPSITWQMNWLLEQRVTLMLTKSVRL